MLLHMTTKNLEVQECNRELGLFPEEISSKKQIEDGTKVLGMKVDSMVIVIFVLALVINLWIVESMEEEVVEAPMTQSDVGHVINSNIFFPHVTH